MECSRNDAEAGSFADLQISPGQFTEERLNLATGCSAVLDTASGVEARRNLDFLATNSSLSR
jgi:hypothetical protein